jgi:hypothetical protein
MLPDAAVAPPKAPRSSQFSVTPPSGVAEQVAPANGEGTGANPPPPPPAADPGHGILWHSRGGLITLGKSKNRLFLCFGSAYLKNHMESIAAQLFAREFAESLTSLTHRG